MGGLGNSSCNSIDDSLWCAGTCPIGTGNSSSMSSTAVSESVSSRVGHLRAGLGSRNEPEPCNGQLRISFSLASPRDPNPLAQPPGSPIPHAARGSQSDVIADSVGNLQVGLSSSILLSSSADVLQGVGSTSCNLLPNSSSRSSFPQSLAPLPQHLAYIFADLTNTPASQRSAGAESQLDLPFSAIVSISPDDRDHLVGLTDSSQDLFFPTTGGSATKDGLDADELDLMVLNQVQVSLDSASKSMLSIRGSAADMATSSGNQDAMMIVEHEKLEKIASELEQELLEEGELEDGELFEGWKCGEDNNDVDKTDLMNCGDDKLEEDELEEEDRDEGIVDYRTEGFRPVVRFGADGRSNQAMVGGFANQPAKDHKKHFKRRKGKGALSRQRKRSRMEKAQKGSNETIIEVNIDGRQQGDHVISTTKVEFTCAGRKAGDKQQQSGSKIVEADTGLEEGEVIEEDNRGLLSQLVEEEVGLWTTDVGDEQITSSKIDSDEDGKKKIRAPISAERKLKKKVAFRRKRAEKEKELGIRRPRLSVNTFKLKVPLCKFYIKGRCTLGAKCTFSHDVVPITKSDPCKFFMVNRCLKGDDCPFSHTLDTFPCKFWHIRGHCLDGNNCRFSHGPLTDDQRQNLAKRIEHDSKEQLNVPDTPTDFNNAAEDSESEHMLTVNSSQTEALSRDVNLPQALNQDTACYASTSVASHSLLNCKEVPPTTPCASSVLSVGLEEMNREEIQITDTYKEDTPAENAVLLAARKAASAAAVQAAGTTDKLLLSRSSSPTSISLPKRRSFGRFLAGRGSEASAMDLLQASFSSDDRCESSRNASSSGNGRQAVSNTATLSSLALCGASAGRDITFPSSSPLSRTAPSNLARGSLFEQSRQVLMPGNKSSAMELLQASLGNESALVTSTREVDSPGF